MQLDRPLALITPTVDGDVLAVLARADAAFTAPDVHRLTPAWSLSGVRKALRRLTEQGIVHVQVAGQTRIYRLNRQHLAAPGIEQLAGLRRHLLARMADRIEQWDPPCVEAGLFGSAARGEMHPASDIDLFVVRFDHVDVDDPRWRNQLDTLERDVTAWTGNDTRILEMSATEVAEATATGDPLLREISRDRVPLAPGPSSTP